MARHDEGLPVSRVEPFSQIPGELHMGRNVELDEDGRALVVDPADRVQRNQIVALPSKARRLLRYGEGVQSREAKHALVPALHGKPIPNRAGARLKQLVPHETPKRRKKRAERSARLWFTSPQTVSPSEGQRRNHLRTVD